MAIVVPIVSEWNPKGLDRSLADIKRAEGAWGKAGVAVQKAAVPAGIALGALTVAAVDFVQAAIDDQSAAARLAQSLGKTTGATQDQIKATEDWIGAQARLGVSDDELRGSIQKLASASGDVEQAQKDAALAMDIAASAGVPVEKAAAAIAKAYDGSRGSLKKLIPGLDAATLKSGDMASVMDEVSSKVGGAAEAFAATDAGGMKAFQITMAETGEAIGAALLPAFQKVMPYVQDFGKWASENTGTLLAIGGAIAGIAGAILAINAAMKIWQAVSALVTAAQWLLNAALAANPIGLIVIAVAAFVAALILAYNKVGWFRDFVDTAFGIVKDVIATVFGWFRDTAWPIVQTVFGFIFDIVKKVVSAWVAAFGKVRDVVGTVFGWLRDNAWPIVQKFLDVVGAAVGVLWSAWKLAFDKIKTAVLTVWEWLRDKFGPPLGILLDGIKTVVGKLGEGFGTAFDAVKSAVSGAWDFISPILDKISGALDWVKSALDKISGAADDAAAGQSRLSNVPGVARSRSGSPITVNVTAGVGNPVEIGRQIETVLRQRQLRLGTP